MRIPAKPKSTVSLGLPKGTATISAYSANWPVRFQEEKARLESALAEYAIRVFHIGSTSIPDLDSKPVIDIAVSLGAPIRTDVLIAVFNALGYTDHRPREADGYPWFEYGRDVSYYQVYVFTAKSRELDRHLKFCEILSGDRALRDAYLALKTDASGRFQKAPDMYAQHKAAFINDVLQGNVNG